MSNIDIERVRAHIGVDPAEYFGTLRALETGALAWVIVSGKMTAGKDTVAPELVDLMPTAPKMLRYGDLMRAELDPALDYMRKVMSRGGTPFATDVCWLMDLPVEQAQTVIDVLSPEMTESALTLTASHRTDGIRTILQSLGDEWRCTDDVEYWARKASQKALEVLAGGSSVILTGGRFLPDVNLPRWAGASLLRLDVTRETQLARLRSRDGLDPSAETLAALDHPSETELDDYPFFDVRVDNNGTLAEALAGSRDGLALHLAHRRAVAA